MFTVVALIMQSPQVAHPFSIR